MFLYYINSTTLISLILKLHFLRTTGQSQLLNSSIKWIFIISHRDHVNLSHMMNKGSPPGYGGKPVCQYTSSKNQLVLFAKTVTLKVSLWFHLLGQVAIFPFFSYLYQSHIPIFWGLQYSLHPGYVGYDHRVFNARIEHVFSCSWTR